MAASHLPTDADKRNSDYVVEAFLTAVRTVNASKRDVTDIGILAYAALEGMNTAVCTEGFMSNDHCAVFAAVAWKRLKLAMEDIENSDGRPSRAQMAIIEDVATGLENLWTFLKPPTGLEEVGTWCKIDRHVPADD